MDTWKLKQTKQCAKCPWKVTTDPKTIPNGYSVEKHKALIDTISSGKIEELNAQYLKIMACHETENAHCIGWLYNQLNQGNNIPLRIQVMNCANINQMELDGKQHQTFNDSLPKQ